jgi:DNA-binding GntR family transcriptional regulator
MDNSHNGHVSLSEQAYRFIREAILQGRLPIGSAISRRKLAFQFGMSLLPISEAILRLENEGLVESRPRSGTRVRIPTPQEIRDLYIMREALESQSARLFSESASPGERRELREMAEYLDAKFDQCANENADPEIIYHAYDFHFLFHMRIAEWAGSMALRAALEKNSIFIYKWIWEVAAQFHAFVPPHWHRTLSDVVAGYDPKAADAAMRRHARFGLNETLATATSLLGHGAGSFRPSRASYSVSQVNSAAERAWRL